MNKNYLLIPVFLLLASCQQQKSHKPSVIFAKDTDTADVVELDGIQQSGTVIAGTLNGPAYYYEWHGHGMGIQYLLADAFAQSIGARLEMQVAKDSAELKSWLEAGQIDFIAIGDVRKKDSAPWETNIQSLRNAMNAWWTPRRESEVLAQFTHRVKQGTRIHRRPMWRNRGRGEISDYDHIFMRHASRIGWDWKLMAAQCFQESGFDPQARSWAGAQGLMQIMPGTALQLGVPNSRIWNPETNIATAARLLSNLNGKYSDIHDSDERINFVLAAYNGGSGHIDDARTLTRKNGGNADKWNDVRHWILQLQYPNTYRDPDVKCGYMRGTETVEYVSSIRSHWNTYRR